MTTKSSEAIILNGKLIAEKKYQAILKNADRVYKKIGRKPKLNVIIASDSDASRVYVGSKQKKGGEIGIEVVLHPFSVESGTGEIVDLIGKINMSKLDDGLIVQQPIFSQLDNEKILSSIDPEKDVDGFTAMNLGMITRGMEPFFYPCTPKGVLELIDETKTEISGKNVVVVGRSNIVGKPVALMLLKRNATVSIAHSRTVNLKDLCLSADILISAVGKPKMIKGDWIKQGAVVIDVGINRDGKVLCGDIDFQSAVGRASFITPVPGGVGPMTVANLMENVVLAAMRGAGIEANL